MGVHHFWWDEKRQGYWQGHNVAGALALPGKAFSMSHAGTRLLVATSARKIVNLDIRR
jgi:hypothetical protein